MNEIYLDNAATTKPRPEVVDAVAAAENTYFYNSAALYGGAIATRREIERCMDVIKQRLTRSGGGELIITSGATEGNNLVIFGKITNPKHHMVVLAGEHSSTYAPSVAIKMNGTDVDYVPLLPCGRANIDALGSLLRKDTTLVVFGLVNSDTGAIQPAREIVDVVREKSPRAHIHCDAVQAFCKLEFDAEKLGVDSLAVSAHKIYGPKGVGALWLRRGVTLKPIMFGGSQQDFRPGTENTAGIVGFACAASLFDTATEYNHILRLRHRLVTNLPSGCSVINPTLPAKFQSPYIANIMLPNVFGHTVMNALSSRGIYVGLGTACSAKASKNRTLIAMGIAENKTKNVLRISFGHNNTEADVDVLLRELQKVLDELG